jgi:putative transposase
MKPKEIPLEPGKYYHVYNRGNNRDNIFYSDENYRYFLSKYDKYLSGYLNTYAYCLLPNHFHLLISVKQEPITPKGFKTLSGLSSETLSGFISKQISSQFSHFFNSFAQAINKQENLVGSLFQKPFKRIEIKTNQHLLNLVFYIHANPQLHNITGNFRKYPWSSYEAFLDNKHSDLQKEVIEWFDDKDNFLGFHNQKAEIAEIKNLVFE